MMWYSLTYYEQVKKPYVDIHIHSIASSLRQKLSSSPTPTLIDALHEMLEAFEKMPSLKGKINKNAKSFIVIYLPIYMHAKSSSLWICPQHRICLRLLPPFHCHISFSFDPAITECNVSVYIHSIRSFHSVVSVRPKDDIKMKMKMKKISNKQGYYTGKAFSTKSPSHFQCYSIPPSLVSLSPSAHNFSMIIFRKCNNQCRKMWGRYTDTPYI